MLLGILFLALGPALLTLSIIAWTGGWRHWTGQFLLGPLPAPITLFPALGLWLIVLGLIQVGALSSRSPLPAVALLALVAGLVLYVWAPSWWGPRWYREMERPVKPDLHDPLTAAIVAGTGETARRRPSKPASNPFTGERPLDSWRGTWVNGDEVGAKEHAFDRPGTVEGTLLLYRDGLTFAEGSVARRLPKEPQVKPPAIYRDDVLDARVVPRGAGPDGHRRRASGLRSPFSRLVIDTSEGSYLFEVQRAKKTAERVRAAMIDNAPRAPVP